MGRPTVMTDIMVDKLILAIERGATLKEIDDTVGLPSAETIRRWQRDCPAFCARVARAREVSADAFESEYLELRHQAVDKDSAAAVRAKAHILERTMARRHPKVYGDKQQIEHTGTIDLAGRIEAGRKRARGE